MAKDGKKKGILGSGANSAPGKLKMDRTAPQKIADNIREVEEMEKKRREEEVEETKAAPSPKKVKKTGSIKITAKQKEYWDTLRTVSKCKFDYELADVLMKSYIETKLTQEEKAYFELLLKFKDM